MRLLLLLLCMSATVAADQFESFRTGTLYAYVNTTTLRNDSVLNPANQLAKLQQRSAVEEARLDFKVENETLRFSLRPIVSISEPGSDAHSYLSQWQLRARATENWNISVGREVMNWGAAQFRSPSSPFYFDNGRSDPMRELSGMDNVKFVWTPDMQRSVTMAHIVRSGYAVAQSDVRPDLWQDSWLAKLDQRGGEWTYGVVAAKAPLMPVFYGAHGQFTQSDALLLYGELGSSAQVSALQSPADVAGPFSVQVVAPRSMTSLLGAAYTVESGNSFNAEYLHDGVGYTSAEQAAYFARAAKSLPLAGMALSYAPRLLGRDYVHLVWQSNIMESDNYRRMMFTHSITGGSKQLAGYGETVLSPHISLFALAVLPIGNARGEFSALISRSVTAGLKFALP